MTLEKVFTRCRVLGDFEITVRDRESSDLARSSEVYRVAIQRARTVGSAVKKG